MSKKLYEFFKVYLYQETYYIWVLFSLSRLSIGCLKSFLFSCWLSDKIVISFLIKQEKEEPENSDSDLFLASSFISQTACFLTHLSLINLLETSPLYHLRPKKARLRTSTVRHQSILFPLNTYQNYNRLSINTIFCLHLFASMDCKIHEGRVVYVNRVHFCNLSI